MIHTFPNPSKENYRNSRREQVVNIETQEKIWTKILEKYTIIKEIYIEAEETSPNLKTNLQPLNEFRAALDHIMKMMYAYYFGGEENEIEFSLQADKLYSHLNRAFYDICDFVSINYRNKITDILEEYTGNVIQLVIPEYRLEYKPIIEEISSRISKYRSEKGKGNSDDTDRFNEYKDDVYTLRDIYLQILEKVPELENAAPVLERVDYILSVGNKYSSDIITKVFPIYYSEWVVNLKDISINPDTDIEYITGVYSNIASKEYLLKDLTKKASRKSWKGIGVSFIVGFISGFVSSVLSTLFTNTKK